MLPESGIRNVQVVAEAVKRMIEEGDGDREFEKYCLQQGYIKGCDRQFEIISLLLKTAEAPLQG
jgi:hypothetical protein